MSRNFRFLIIDGYPKASRDELVDAGCSRACDLYARLVEVQFGTEEAAA